ncbi:MAG: hypothetical protein FWC62_00085 [Firmicutes bacterium]|nr:hypothetical protein [Bacillota bacterium]
MKKFDGIYYKHQNGDSTVVFIAGTAADHAFIQVITGEGSRYFRYPLTACSFGETLRIGGSFFSNEGIALNIEEADASIRGNIRYSGLTPLHFDIMGPFRFLPMQCRHRIVSLYHRLDGGLAIGGKIIDFSGGTGYIEGDAGSSFPAHYAWVQCNSFSEKACVTVSVADVPFAGRRFRGCIGVVYAGGVTYRLATYLGCRPLRCDETGVILEQGKLRLEIETESAAGHTLLAPERGAMVREIREALSCPARFQLTQAGNALFERRSDSASFEYV